MSARLVIDSRDANSSEYAKSVEMTGSSHFDTKNANSRRQFTSGWRGGALLSCIAVFTVLLINISVLIWTLSNSDMVQGTGTLYKGNCARTKSLNTWLQLVINVLSTILLGASNYCMQSLTAPTRQEVDEAHKQKHLLRIGVPSMRNLKAISRGRVYLWIGLGLSALPLHFL